MFKANKYLPFLAIVFLAGFLFCGLSSTASASGSSTDTPTPPPPPPAADKNVISLDDPLQAGNAAPAEIINRLASALVAPVGALAFVFLVVGGFYWIFSAGNEERVKKGKDIILWTMVGILVVFSSYAILSFVFRVLLPATQ